MVAVEQNQPATIQNAPKLSKLRSVVLNPFVQQASFSSITFVIAKAFTQRKTRPLLHKLASSLHCLVSSLRFACGAWPSTGRGVVRASRIRSVKIKTVKIEDSGCIF